MPLRAPKMYGFIFGFHRLVWCPKWTPASSRFFIVTSVIRFPCWTGAHTRTRPADATQGSRGSLVHRVEELLVVLRTPDLVVEEFHRLHRVQLGEELAEDPHPVEHFPGEQQLLFSCAGTGDVHRREHALVHQAPVEVDLHVAGALELLEDDLVHPTAGVDERGADDGEAAAVLDVARRAEELLRPAERIRVDAA